MNAKSKALNKKLTVKGDNTEHMIPMSRSHSKKKYMNAKSKAFIRTINRSQWIKDPDRRADAYEQNSD